MTLVKCRFARTCFDGNMSNSVTFCDNSKCIRIHCYTTLCYPEDFRHTCDAAKRLHETVELHRHHALLDGLGLDIVAGGIADD